jgi:putative ABC transport system substrate-binding protein
MRIKKIILPVLAIFLATVSLVQAQQPKKVSRVGLLVVNPFQAVATRVEAFRQGLHDLGYVEGQNIVIDGRFADGKLDRMPELAAELVRLKVDIIVTGGPQATRPAKEATNTIPIVMTQDSDPVGEGFVASLARPGGNITGLTNLSAELSGKRLELLKEIVPKLSRVVAFGNVTNPGNAKARGETEDAARTLGLKLQYMEVQSADGIESAFKAASKGQAQAIIMLNTRVGTGHRKRVVELAARNRLPATYPQMEFADVGGLMFYGANAADLYRRAAIFVDKILKGTQPADLPVEQPTKFELVINLKAAKQIGLTIPPNVLARADKVIR